MALNTSPSGDSRRFPSTAWSFLRELRETPDAKHGDAMNEFLARYWKPVFYFLRVRGYPLPHAEDLTQEFFLRLFERDWMSRADQQRGRFRTFLLTLLTRFLSDDGPQRAAKQLTFERQIPSISSLIADEDRRFEPSGSETPEAMFHKQMAVELVDRARQRLKQFYDEQGLSPWYELFAAVHSTESGERRLSQKELAARHQLSVDQVRYRLSQIEQQFAALLRDEVRDQVSSEDEVEPEIHDLLHLLAKTS